AARTSEDILSWVQANGHPSLGIYWRNEDGSKEYKTCRASVIDIRAAMDAEGTKGIKTLAGRLFGYTPGDRSVDHLRPIMEGAWKMISNSTRNASQQVQQMMVVNAQKEAFDDAREAHGKVRLHPELVSMNAARNLESQASAGFMKSFAGSISMPLLQAFLFGLMSVMFLLVIPFAFLPGGLKILALWAKMMFSIQLWPVFSTIINAFSISLLQRSAETVMDGSVGFSIATTSGLADAAYSVAGQVSGMQLAVPIIAWGFVAGGQFAITQIMQGATGGMDAGATRMAAEATDGNLSMGNQNLMNETIASRSVAQQNNVGSHNYAETLNTGSQVVTQGENGEMTVQENQDTLRENFSSSGQLNSVIGTSLRDSQTMTEQKQNSFNKSLSDTSGEMKSFAEKLSTGTIAGQGVSKDERAAMTQTANETLRLANEIQKKYGVSAQTGIEAAVRASLGTGGLGKMLGIELNASGGITSNAQNQESLDKVMNSSEGKELAQQLQKLKSIAQDDNIKITDSSGTDVSSSLNRSLNDTQSSGEAYSRSVVTTKNWEKTQSLNAQNSVGTNTNENAPWLEFLGQKTGLSKADLVSRINQGGFEMEGYKAEFLSTKQAAIRSAVENGDHLFSDKEVQGYLTQMPQINPQGRDRVQSAIDSSGLKPAQALQDQFVAYKKEAEGKVRDHNAHLDNERSTMEKGHHQKQEAFEYENSRTNMARSDEKMNRDMASSAVGIYDDVTGFFKGDSEGVSDNPLEGASNAWKPKPKQQTVQEKTNGQSDAQKAFDEMNKGRKTNG
ncbi:MAG: conjugal transfer protein TraG N-terminal domain-containing protein, partial [Simkaniaceae bacterium]|nr:conjugal transfer protein TraG N-terminal domain-containing protein [Simkaniaceae bacterium]